MTEEWRPIEAWPYEVSSNGRVRRTGAATGAVVGRVLRAKRTRHGYLKITLSRPGEQQQFFVHRLVAAAFYGPPADPRLNAAHLNGIRDDNRAANLLWCSPAVNQGHQIEHGTRAQGERSGLARLTNSDVLTMRRLFAAGAARRPLRERFGISRSHFDSIVAGRFWKHLPLDGDTSP